MVRGLAIAVTLFGIVFVGSTAGYALRIMGQWEARERAWRETVAAESAAAQAARDAVEAARQAALAAVRERAGSDDYHAARWDPLHVKPAIDQATDEQCLVCHADILERRPLDRSPAGVPAADSLAWYQTLDTYQGDQDTFHRRHLESAFAKEVMTLSCSFCHQGNDPREEAPTIVADGGQPPFTLRKMVNPSETCLRCHGRFPWEVMEGLPGPWSEARADFEDEETPNGCLVCHEDLYRTTRHQVTYLRPDAIEAAAKDSSDVCYGCHGGRAWFMTSYPYPRHPWPDMPEEMPDWARDRPTSSDARFRLPTD